jgi:O-antigen ligase
MKVKETNYLAKILIFGVMTITLIITPGLNKDSLVIPKVMVFFCLALYMVPIILKSLKGSLADPYIKKLIILAFLLLIDGILILLNSSAPIEQLFFGRSGRAMGFITFISFIIILLASSIIIKFAHIKILLNAVIAAGLVTSFYSCIQFFGLDVFKWSSKTNGIIGTLGNPNSQSSFAAMIFIPTVVILWTSKYKWLLVPSTVLALMFTLYISQSTQGYISVISSILAITLIFLWYRNKLIFFILTVFSTLLGIVAVFGMLGHGPLSYYLYKISVQSRGDFWRSAITTGNSHPIFGVGFDSFGDYMLKYRDEVAASHSFAEYADSAHNFYLDYLATGGYVFLLLNIFLTIFVLRAFFVLQRNKNGFDKHMAALFCTWLGIQLQSMINTQTIAFVSWNALISGAVIGMAGTSTQLSQSTVEINAKRDKLKNSNLLGSILLIIGLIIMFPYFNNDRLTIKANNSGNGDLLIRATTAYPEFALKYSQASQALLESGLPAPSLFLARKGVEFNPNSVSLWALILANPTASIEDRQIAKSKILELDPLNKEVKAYSIQ